MTEKRWFLIVPANGKMPRITKMQPNLNVNEVAYRLVVRSPESWGRVQTAIIGIDLPDPPIPTPQAERLDDLKDAVDDVLEATRDNET